MAAPSRISRAPGERVKTDRRDAMKLAKLMRLGELVAVRVPSACEEGAREDARADLMHARHRLSKLLLRQGLVWDGSAWTQGHERWLAERFEARGLQIAYEEAVAAMLGVRARCQAIDAAIVEEAAKEPWATTVGRLACLRGVSTLTAFGLATEIGDWERFDVHRRWVRFDARGKRSTVAVAAVAVCPRARRLVLEPGDDGCLRC